ncbi:MAG: signal recognition particle receptor subunit alpha, partial [Rhodobacteraceae bacterium]|nr:signal recognition particle receptor subunit alpha [Paracoccaceae bacterium]
MSFFSKLKSRLTKSTTKLEQGLEDLIEEGEEENLSALDSTNLLDQDNGDKQKSGLLGKIFSGGGDGVSRRRLDDEMLESLEELLIVSDMGYDTSIRISSSIAQNHMGQRLSTHQLKTLLSSEITSILEPVAKPIPLFSVKPQVILIAGVNGSGKTTTIGKLSSQFKEAGKDIVIAACDTFRAAAVEQLEIWGEKVGVPVLKASANSDPAALAYKAYTLA